MGIVIEGPMILAFVWLTESSVQIQGVLAEHFINKTIPSFLTFHCLFTWSFVRVFPRKRFGHYFVEGHIHIRSDVLVEVLVQA